MPVLTTISPITSRPIITTAATTLEQLDQEILPLAVSAQKEWFRSSNLNQRKELVQKFSDLIASDEISTLLGRELTEQMGRPIRYTKGELSTASLRINTLLGFADAALQPKNASSDGPIDFEGPFKRYLTHEPHGVVLIIFPWNYPYLCLVNALIPALLVGNSVLIKPSPQTPDVAKRVVELFDKVGLPHGVIQQIHSGDAQFLETLITRKSVSAVAFTGSVQGGLAVQKAAVGRTIPIALELGGNDPAYVRADIGEKDLTSVVENIVDGAIFNSGQSCCAIERVYVDEAIYDDFVKAAVKEVRGYKVGDPLDPTIQIGPVVSEASANNIRKQVQDAITKGAKALIGPEIFAEAEKINPTFVGPQILVDLAEDSGKS